MTIELVANSPERKPATVAELAAMEFKAVKEFRGLGKVRRLKKIHGLADDVRAMSVIAVEILAFSKPELVAKLSEEEGHELFGSCLMELARAWDTAQMLKELIHSAEIRLACALAVVEGPMIKEADGGAA